MSMCVCVCVYDLERESGCLTDIVKRRKGFLSKSERERESRSWLRG